MIRREQVIGLLLEACPSYNLRWETYRNAPEFDVELLYVHLGDFADHVIDLLERDERSEFPAFIQVLERLHLDGDDDVKEAATIGLLEGIQNIAGHRKVSTESFEAALSVEMQRWWRSLDAFWSGKVPYVGAGTTKGSG
jgi:hypothetical protein